MIRFVVTMLLVAVTGEWIARYTGLLAPTIHATVSNSILLLVTLLYFRLLSNIQDQQRFTQVYLMSIVVKILLACILIVVLILLDKSHARSNVIFLFSMYVLFTMTEIIFLVRLRSARGGAKKNQKISF